MTEHEPDEPPPDGPAAADRTSDSSGDSSGAHAAVPDRPHSLWDDVDVHAVHPGLSAGRGAAEPLGAAGDARSPHGERLFIPGAPSPVDLPSLDVGPRSRRATGGGPRRPSRAALVAAAAVVALVAVTVPRLVSTDDVVPAEPTPPVVTAPVRGTAVGGQRPGLVVGPDLSSPSDLPQQPTHVLKPFADNPVRSWRLTLADAVGLTLRESLALPEAERPDAGTASFALPLPAAAGTASTADTLVVAVNPGTEPVWESVFHGLPTVGGGRSTYPSTTLLIGIDAESGERRWTRSIAATRAQPCQVLARGQLVACLTRSGESASVVVLEADTGHPTSSFATSTCVPDLFLQDGGRLYWAGRDAGGVCLGGGLSGALVARIPGVRDLAWEDLTMGPTGPLLRTAGGSVLRDAERVWRGYDGRVEPGPDGLVIQEVPGTEHVYSDASGERTTARSHPATVVLRAEDNVVLATLAGAAWRRPDLGQDATPVDELYGLVGAGVSVYVPFGAATMTLRDGDGGLLPAPVAGTPERIVASRIGIMGTTTIAGTTTQAEWNLDGRLLSESDMLSTVVGVRGETTFVLSGIPGRDDSTWLRVLAEPDANLWVAQVAVDPAATLLPFTASSAGAPTVHAALGRMIVVREPDGLVGYQ